MPTPIYGSYSLSPGGRFTDSSSVRVTTHKVSSRQTFTVAIVTESLEVGPNALPAAATIAATAAVNAIAASAAKTPLDLIDGAFRKTAETLHQQEQITGKRTYCSMVIALITDRQRLYVGSIGLVRVYVHSRARKLRQITLEHTVGSTRLQKGEAPEIVFQAPDSNRPTRAIGHGEPAPDIGIYIDTLNPANAFKQGREGLPLRTGDSVLVCTRGVYGTAPTGQLYVTDQEMAASLTALRDTEAARAIVERAMERKPDSSASAAVLQMARRRLMQGVIVPREILAAFLLLLIGGAFLAGVFAINNRREAEAQATFVQGFLDAQSRFSTQSVEATQTAAQGFPTIPATLDLTAAAVALEITAEATESATDEVSSVVSTTPAPELTASATTAPSVTATASPSPTATLTRTVTPSPTAAPPLATPTLNANNLRVEMAALIGQMLSGFNAFDPVNSVDTYDGVVRQLAIQNADGEAQAQFILFPGSQLRFVRAESELWAAMTENSSVFVTTLDDKARVVVQLETNPDTVFTVSGSCLWVQYLQPDLVMASCLDGTCTLGAADDLSSHDIIQAGEQVIMQPSTQQLSPPNPITTNEYVRLSRALPLSNPAFRDSAVCIAAIQPTNTPTQRPTQRPLSTFIPPTRTPITTVPAATVTPSIGSPDTATLTATQDVPVTPVVFPTNTNLPLSSEVPTSTAPPPEPSPESTALAG